MINTITERTKRMKTHKNPKIDVVCAFCEFLHIEKTAEGEELLSCKYKKSVEADGHCFRFRYDVLKRKPNLSLPPIALDPETLVLD